LDNALAKINTPKYLLTEFCYNVSNKRRGELDRTVTAKVLPLFRCFGSFLSGLCRLRFLFSCHFQWY